MRSSICRSRVSPFRIALMTLLCACPLLGVRAEVLILTSGALSHPWPMAVISGFHERSGALQEQGSLTLPATQFESIYDDLAKPVSPELMDRRAHALVDKFAGHSFDRIVALESTAIAFLNDYPDLFPTATRVGVVSHSELPAADFPLFKLDELSAEPLGLIVTLLPEIKRLVVLHQNVNPGAFSRLVQQWTERYSDRFTLEEWNAHDFSFAEIDWRLQHLPPGSAVSYMPVLSDRSGEMRIPLNYLKHVVRQASVPVFVNDAQFVGESGAVGGWVVSPAIIGAQLANLAYGLELEEQPSGLKYPLVDAAQLERFGLDLPAERNGLVVLNESPDFVSEYGWLIGLAVLLLATLACYSALLQRLVLKRTAMLNDRNASLIVALDEARLARKAESRFLSNMSHEIRNPLNAVVGMVRQALEEIDLDVIRDSLTTAAAAGQHLKSIVDDILDFKKIEAGEFTLKPASFDFFDAIRLMAKAHYEVARLKGVELHQTMDFESLPRYLIGDQKRLIQVAMNLISNAIKFTPRGGAVYSIPSYDYGTHTLTLSVRDTGIGMTPTTQRALFQRFKQGDEGATKEFEGTGLGLAITRHLLELMGGDIRVDSTPGEGSTFVVSAPIEVDWERERAWRNGDVDTPDLSDIEQVDLSGRKVLCVDDVSVNLMIIAKPLTNAGATVVTATSGREALRLAKEQYFDIVLSDISMPEMDGEQLRRELSQMRSNLPVVAVTGNVLEENVSRYLEDGFAAVIGKPLDPDQLTAVVGRCAASHH